MLQTNEFMNFHTDCKSGVYLSKSNTSNTIKWTICFNNIPDYCQLFHWSDQFFHNLPWISRDVEPDLGLQHWPSKSQPVQPLFVEMVEHEWNRRYFFWKCWIIRSAVQIKIIQERLNISKFLVKYAHTGKTILNMK